MVIFTSLFGLFIVQKVYELTINNRDERIITLLTKLTSYAIKKNNNNKIYKEKDTS